MTEALLGAATGILTIVVARAVRGERWMYAIGLLVLPALYTLFALRTGERALVVEEMLWGVPFVAAGLGFAFVSVRYSAIAVGVLWGMHGAYDLLHDRFFTNPGVPGWYPAWCCAVDGVVGAYLLWLSRRLPGADLRRAGGGGA